ncbi:hypothetical protein BJ912DRAFT_1040990 [Pholiota molesta]|nr:hypothetical protein BJ912DRAFT_1040990 [Pholiota molesta]
MGDWALHLPARAPRDARQLARDDRAADVRHQHFYSSTIFVPQAGYSAKQAMLASWGFGLVNWLFAFPAVWTIDTFGRRNLLLFTFPKAWTLLAARVPLIVFFIFLFAAFYSPGERRAPFTSSAEDSHRDGNTVQLKPLYDFGEVREGSIDSNENTKNGPLDTRRSWMQLG